MTRNYLFGIRPFRLISVDADTGKPLDSNVGRKTYVTYYNVKKSKDGKKSIIAHRSPAPSAAGGDAKGEAGNEDKKKGDNGNKNGNGGDKKNEDKKGGGGGGGEGADNKNANEKPWTEDEDKELRELKEKNTIWKDIAAELKRNQNACKARWKEINGGNDEQAKKADKGGDDKKKDEEKKEEKKDGGGGGGENKQMTKKEKKAAKKASAEDEGKKAAEPKAEQKPEKKAEQKPQKKSSAKAPSKAGSKSGEARFTMNEWLTLQEDDLFSFGELQCLSELIMKDQNMTWLRIAAIFYDKTGRRVHPDDIREKFEEMARMG